MLHSTLSSAEGIPEEYGLKSSNQESKGDVISVNQVHKNDMSTNTLKRCGARSGGCGKRKKWNKPRWHTQMYIMFLALRQHPKREASRTELIKAAVALDKSISEERNLPRVFTGKTPMNSASACLTTNGDKYFIPFKPEGAKSTHFRLAYEPGNFESARVEYNKWMDKLIKYDWPLCFGKKRESSKEKSQHKSTSKIGNHLMSSELGGKLSKKTTLTSASVNDVKNEAAPFNSENISRDPAVLPYESLSMVSQDEPDCPTKLEEIVVLKDSTDSNTASGLRAVRFIPAWTPLGFYFGVPMTEDEFDSLKDGVGLASHYSMMYRRTVLDATDDKGMPFSNPDGHIWCPYHFMNEDAHHGNVAFLEGYTMNQIICMSTCDIEVGEELLAYYSSEIDSSYH
ncbi:hypothetical protein K493DRAFT_316387 [Basidiobolus meristosporus CBS 931.73]|uniref:SET domain-containing protein n=1 Tax=Basidiobolus meristosporus CBS 931.73 TaxID=1314790 RepID=A0A1Y1Y4G0_9FUNG|nr:hypothetical protein K493DRAFT_316387 [Basidiobolus meristosporus CBS 931.73]|eukprot:ORX92785.1 hypothetical protein K493DRAFT_316387 [Basidiobolus meristosporus CBS 931.73]